MRCEEMKGYSMRVIRVWGRHPNPDVTYEVRKGTYSFTADNEPLHGPGLSDLRAWELACAFAREA